MKKNMQTVLCVDDDPEVLNILEIMLRRRGLRVLSASNPASGIEFIKNFRCDAAIVDYAMPGMNGGELARELRGVQPGLPIILHTGYADIEDPLLAYVDCTVPKGSFASLMAKLNELLHLPNAEQATEVKAGEKASAA